jgi:hypothetical protein
MPALVIRTKGLAARSGDASGRSEQNSLVTYNGDGGPLTECVWIRSGAREGDGCGSSAGCSVAVLSQDC